MDTLQDNIVAGKYILQKRIGAGKHGEVFQAQVMGTNETVAVKLFNYYQNHEILHYIRKEFVVLERLSHPHILKIFACGRWKQGNNYIFYLVTPLMDGGDLADYIKLHYLSIQNSIRMCLDIASTLLYMHQNHFIHRDVKPQNILLDKNNNVVLSDFGIATTTQNTHTIVAGTMEYCPPEQVENMFASVPDVRLDVYGLGMTLYEMLCRVNPYRKIAQERGDAAAIQYKYTKEFPLVTQYNQAIPHELALIVAKMIASNPDARYSNMQAVIEELELYKDYQVAPLLNATEMISITDHQIQYIEQAIQYMNSNQPHKALEIYNHMLTENLNIAYVHKQMGAIYLQMKQFENALYHFEQALQQNTKSYSTLCNLAYSSIMLHSFDKAFAYLQSAFEIAPQRAEAYFYQALYHREQAKLYKEEQNLQAYKNEIIAMHKAQQQYKTISQSNQQNNK